jgi:phage-related baseplate assembly protein
MYMLVSTEVNAEKASLIDYSIHAKLYLIELPDTGSASVT